MLFIAHVRQEGLVSLPGFVVFLVVKDIAVVAIVKSGAC